MMCKVNVDVEIVKQRDVPPVRMIFPLPDDVTFHLMSGLAEVISKPVLVGLLHLQQLYVDTPGKPREWTCFNNQEVIGGIIPIFCQYTTPLFIHLHHVVRDNGYRSVSTCDYDIVASAFHSIISTPINLTKLMQFANANVNVEQMMDDLDLKN